MSNVGFSYEIGVIISAGGVLQKLYCMLPDKVYVVILDLEENSPQYPAQELQQMLVLFTNYARAGKLERNQIKKIWLTKPAIKILIYLR